MGVRSSSNPWRQRERARHSRHGTGRSNHRLERAQSHDGVVQKNKTRAPTGSYLRVCQDARERQPGCFCASVKARSSSAPSVSLSFIWFVWFLWFAWWVCRSGQQVRPNRANKQERPDQPVQSRAFPACPARFACCPSPFTSPERRGAFSEGKGYSAAHAHP